MMKQIIIALFIGIACPVLLTAQVGINTMNPVGMFHIDSQSNTSGSSNTTDDIVVDANGNMGIGTTTPTAKLELKSTGTAATPVPAIKIVDGAQARGKLLRTQDDEGTALWTIIPVPQVQSNLMVSSIQPYPLNSTATSFLKTGAYIDLPVGKWEVKVSMRVNVADATKFNIGDWVLIRTTFVDDVASDPSTSYSADLGDTKYISGLHHGQNIVLVGSVFINNTSGATKRYVYAVGNFTVSNTSAMDGNIDTLGVDNEESFIVATPAYL